MNLQLPANQPSQRLATMYLLWNYVQHELIYLCWGLMDVALITPISLTLIRWTRFWPPGEVLLWLLLLMLIPFNLARLMSVLSIPAQRQQTVMAVTLLTIFVLAMRTLLYPSPSFFDFTWARLFFANLAEAGNLLWIRDLAIFFLIVLMWWRGLRLANREFDISRAGLRLRVGGLIIAPFAIWFTYRGVTWGITPFLLLFFLAGLTAVALIRAEEVEKQHSGLSAAFNPRWLTLVLAAGLLTVFTAGALAIIISGDAAETIVGWLAPIWLAIYFGATVAVITFTYVILPLLTVVGFLIQLLVQVMTPVFQLWQSLPGLQRQEPLTITPFPTEAVEAISGASTGAKLIIILIMLAVVLMVALVLGRLYQQAVVAARDSEFTTAGDDAPDESAVGQRLLRRLGLLRGWRAAASIRRIYQQMMKAAAAVGYPRAESETPYEYLATLAKAWPENTADTQLITEAYVKVRYGEVPETKEELDQIRRAWQKLEQTRPATSEVEQRKTVATS
jgi:hypothetical protein